MLDEKVLRENYIESIAVLFPFLESEPEELLGDAADVDELIDDEISDDETALEAPVVADLAANPAPDAKVLLDMASFEQLVRTHSARLQSFVRRRIGNHSDVEEIVQDTLLEALKGLARYRGSSRPETWLFGIAMNLIRNYYKRTHGRKLVDLDEEVETLPTFERCDPAEVVEHRQTLERLNAILSQVNPDTRLILELVFDECMTYEEAAVALGIPVGTVRSRISRVRVQLRQGAV